MKSKAAVAWEAGKPLEIEEIEVGTEKLEHEEKKDPVPELNQPILKLHGAVDG